MKHILFLCFILIALSGCTGSSNSNDAQDVVAKGDRTVGMDINMAGNGEFSDYETAFIQVINDLKVAEVKQSWDWDVMETDPGTFDNTFPDIANVFFPAFNTPVTLIFRPVNTNLRSIPDDLLDNAFDDEEMLTRFNAFIDHVHSRIPSLVVKAVYVGNEIDIYLGNDSAEWNRFATFFEGAIEHVKNVFGPTVLTGTIGTIEGLTDESLIPEFAKLLQRVDLVGVTYYPMDGNFQVQGRTEILSDFDRVVELYSSKEIRFVECGYPTSASNGSSDEMQVEFVKALFEGWDKHANSITHMDFNWLFDLSHQEASELSDFYGITNTGFFEYLRTLGLRENNGDAKPGYDQLMEELEVRGW